jgi:4-amino-4-deoxy-L-arabinose transferase-like glycosyltransferase
MVLVAVACGVRLDFHLLYRDWFVDELTYRQAALAMRHGDYFANPEHPPLAKELMALGMAVLGSSLHVLRAMSIALAVGTAVALGFLGRDIAGRWAGLVAAALFLLVPWPSATWDVGRLAILDPYMAFFTSVALLAGLRWSRTGAWSWALAAGVAIGGATACKLPGVLTLPAVFGLPLLAARFGRRVVIQACAAFGAAAAAFVAPFLPAGTRIATRMWHTVSAQTEHSGHGHPVVINGTIYTHPPWWVGPYDIARGNPAVLLLFVIAAIAAPFVLDRLIAAFLLAAALVPLGFFAFVAGVQLPFYPYAYAPAMALTMGTVTVVLYRRPGRALAYVVTAIAVGAVAIGVSRAVTRPRGDMQRAAALLAPHLRPGDGVVTASTRDILRSYLPPGVRELFNASHGYRVVAVVVDPAWVRLSPDRRALPPQWQAAIAGRTPIVVGGLRVYLLT